MFVSSDLVRCVAFDPQKSNILASCSNDETIKIWDIESGSCLSTLTGDKPVNGVAFSPDGNTLAAGDGGFMQAGNVRLYDVHTGEVKSTLTGHTGPVTQVEFIDADTVVSSSDDGTTRAWDVATGTQKAEFEGEKFSFTTSTDGKQEVGQYVVTKEGDLVLVHLTHAVTGTEAAEESNQAIAFFRAPAVVASLECAGDRIAVGCENGEVLHLQAPWLVEEA